MTYIVVAILMLALIVDVSGVHFLGGTITWRLLNQSATGTPIPSVITQTYSWTYSLITCTDAMIATSQLIPLGVYTNLATETLDCIANCGNGSLGYVAPTIVPRCTDISEPIGTTVGQRSDTVYLEVGDDFSAAFQLVGWRPLTPYPTSVPWSISTRIIIKARSDNGLYNNAPAATMMSPINIPVHIPTVINVPVADTDGDPLRCRWSANDTAGADECGGVCPPESLPSNTTIYPNCTIIITGENIGDWFAVALMVEDFINISSTTPLSSVPVQFLVHVVGPPTCTTPPEIVGKPTEQSCTSVVIGQTFTSQLIANNYCGSNVTIVDIATLSFPGMVKGNITALDAATYYIDISWTPTASQLGYQVMCAMAFDSENSQSAQYCFKFYVSEINVCSCPGEDCVITTTTYTKQKPASYDWPFIGTVIGLTLLGAVTLCSCLCYRYCRLIGGRSNRHNDNEPCVFYHIEQCTDQDCPWRDMKSSPSILSSRLISSENNVYFENSRGLPTRTITSMPSYSTDDDTYLTMVHSQSRNYPLMVGDHNKAKSTVNIGIFDFKLNNALENDINSDVKSSIRRTNENAVDSPLVKLNTNDNRKVSQVKSIAKDRKKGSEYGVLVTHLHSQASRAKHQSSINNERPIIIKNTIHSLHHDETNQTSKNRKDDALVNHVHLGRQQLRTNQHNCGEIETIELSALDSIKKPLSVIAGTREISAFNVDIQHIHKAKRGAK